MQHLSREIQEKIVFLGIFGVFLWLQIKHLHVDAIETSQALTDKVLCFVFFKLTYVNFLLKFSLFRLQIAPIFVTVCFN